MLHLCQQDPCYTQQCPLSNPCPGGVSLSSDPWQASEAPTSLPPGLGAMGSQEGGSSQSMHDLMALLTPWFAICISAGISAIALRQCPLSDSQQESSPPKRHHSGTLSVEKKNMGDAERKKSILCQKSWLVVLVQPIEGGCTWCIRPEISSCINFPASLAYLVILQELMSPLEEGLTSCQADTQQCYHPITKSLTVSSNNLYLCRPAPPAHMPHLTKQ